MIWMILLFFTKTLRFWAQDYIENIRAAYTKNFTSKDVTKRQIAVATYLIDKLAMRAGNEKVYFVQIYFSYAYLIICKHPLILSHTHIWV